MSNKVIENNNINASKEFIRCLEIEHDIMLLENQIKNLTQEKGKLVNELECLKEQMAGKVDIKPRRKLRVKSLDKRIEL
jgi:hypothetical protein